MRDDTARWDAPGPLAFASDALTLTEVLLPSQHWVSGVDVLARYRDQLVSWPEVAQGDRYGLALRRDRVLLVGETDLKTGFVDETGLAITDVSDAFQVLDISGPTAFDRLRQGAELRLDQSSASVMRRVFGAEAMLYRAVEATRFRLHVPRAEMQAVFRQLAA